MATYFLFPLFKLYFILSDVPGLFCFKLLNFHFFLKSYVIRQMVYNYINWNSSNSQEESSVK